ncbi:MAG: DNA repair protein RecO [Candidatus Marinamargulisbacteria bacterium]
MRHIKTEGIVMSSKPFFEKDKLCQVYSPTLGRIQVLLKRAGKSGFKHGNGIESCTFIQAELFRGKTFYYLNQSQITQTYLHIRADLGRIDFAFYVFDIIRKATPEEQSNKPLFDLVSATLFRINEKEPIVTIRPWFHREFLAIEGLLESATEAVSETAFKRAFEDYSGKILPDR